MTFSIFHIQQKFKTCCVFYDIHSSRVDSLGKLAVIPTTVWLLVAVLLYIVLVFILSMVLEMHDSSVEGIFIVRFFIGGSIMAGCNCFLGE